MAGVFSAAVDKARRLYPNLSVGQLIVRDIFQPCDDDKIDESVNNN